MALKNIKRLVADLLFAAEKCRADDFDTFLSNVRSAVSNTAASATLIAYPWELIQHNPDAIRADFAALGKSGIEGTFSEHAAIWGDKNQVYVAKGAEVQSQR